MNRSKLDEAALAAALAVLNTTAAEPWTLQHGRLHKVFAFRDFNEAFGFMTRCALVAAAMDHHPDWSNRYQSVRVDLFTHDADGITELDFLLAGRMEAILGAAR